MNHILLDLGKGCEVSLVIAFDRESFWQSANNHSDKGSGDRQHYTRRHGLLLCGIVPNIPIPFLYIIPIGKPDDHPRSRTAQGSDPCPPAHGALSPKLEDFYLFSFQYSYRITGIPIQDHQPILIGKGHGSIYLIPISKRDPGPVDLCFLGKTRAIAKYSCQENKKANSHRPLFYLFDKGQKQAAVISAGIEIRA